MKTTIYPLTKEQKEIINHAPVQVLQVLTDMFGMRFNCEDGYIVTIEM